MTEVRSPQAYKLAADDKKTLVMIYTANTLIRGEAVTKESIRTSIWLRTQGAPDNIHLMKASLLLFGGAGSVKQLSFSEYIVPVGEVLAFHLVPPAADPLDYDESESNRIFETVTGIVGTFRFDGMLRISSQSDIVTHLNVSRSAWLSIYNLEISNPYLTGMGVLKVPMALVRPTHIHFGLNAAQGQEPSAAESA